ncbi:hypothetical protein, partial [Bacillus cereus]
QLQKSLEEVEISKLSEETGIGEPTLVDIIDALISPERDMRDDMVHGANGNNYEVIIDRKEAIYHAIANAKAEDIIIIAGKGH